MPFDLFTAIVEDILRYEAPRKCYLNLWGWGEPLLHPDIFDMSAFAADKGCKVRISTNLEPLKPASIDNLLTCGIATLFIALDGMSDSTHGAYRVRGNVKSVLSLIKTVCSRRCALGIGPNIPHLVVTTLLTKQAESDLDLIEDFCRSVGVDALVLKYPNLWRSNKSAKDSKELYQRFLEGSKCAGRYRHDGLSTELASFEGACPFTRKNGVVLWNGDVVPCCFDHDALCSIDRITERKSYFDLLSGQEWGHFQDRMEKKRFPICASCDSCGPRREVVIFNESLVSDDVLEFS